MHVRFPYTISRYDDMKLFSYPVRLRTRGRVITLSVHPWICLFVCDTKMSTLSETVQFMSSTYHIRVRNGKILASTCLTNESVLQEAAFLKLLFNIGDLYQKNNYYHIAAQVSVGDRNSG